MNGFGTHISRTILALMLLWLPAVVPALADPPHPVLYKGEKLVPVDVPANAPLKVSGWTRDGKGLVYALHVRQGQTVGIDFATPSQFTYLVIFDVARPDDEALYSSDEDGKVKTLPVAANTTWLLRPYYSRVAPRRGMGAPYTIGISVR